MTKRTVDSIERLAARNRRWIARRTLRIGVGESTTTGWWRRLSATACWIWSRRRWRSGRLRMLRRRLDRSLLRGRLLLNG
jgi:hypothetical protein